MRRPTPAAEAISSTVVASYPCSENFSIAATVRAWRSRLRPAVVLPTRGRGADRDSSDMWPNLTGRTC
ncbi:hypothetical protein GCM10017786_16480 [Amycolatopsis deserti]|uniref:Uncharacterized protein n=1 Tax=Amycolatopsis deserti TaxID=185696 RepID=A0ABQ3IMC1_9PSEU|nr:hypothetical protein GCM10017786_16480 [Amycolatopsis deserti]